MYWLRNVEFFCNFIFFLFFFAVTFFNYNDIKRPFSAFEWTFNFRLSQVFSNLKHAPSQNILNAPHMHTIRY